MVSFFYQSSTRTRASFEFAMDYLGGKVVFSTENAREFSSGAKGESLKDTIKVLNRYGPDVIVLRYDSQIDFAMAMDISKVPIINAGDRNPGQHPTQALLDLRTILKCRGAIDGLTITMVGDLKNGRTVRSLCYLLGKFKGVSVHLVSPKTTKMEGDVLNYLSRHDVVITQSTDLRKVAKVSDVIYQTRTQTECGGSIDRKDHELGYFVVNREIMNIARADAIIMHPLPRVDEITEEVDDDPRAVYLTHQIDSGLFTRMALLKIILAPHT
jgi:aspartate carbamoyltransferase catalytic subunit